MDKCVFPICTNIDLQLCTGFSLWCKDSLVPAGVAQWWSAGLPIKGPLVGFPVRAHAWVAR